jgi:formylglycine-generating enzyme required for sulfatase activity
MAGNVWEWTSSLYRPYPYDADDGREDAAAEGQRVIRGGSYNEGPLVARSAWRKAAPPARALADVGFRVACEAK